MINHLTNIATPSCLDQGKKTKKRRLILTMGVKKTLTVIKNLQPHSDSLTPALSSQCSYHDAAFDMYIIQSSSSQKNFTSILLALQNPRFSTKKVPRL
jgi:hypothetical protein